MKLKIEWSEVCCYESEIEVDEDAIRKHLGLSADVPVNGMHAEWYVTETETIGDWLEQVDQREDFVDASDFSLDAVKAIQE